MQVSGKAAIIRGIRHRVTRRDDLDDRMFSTRCGIRFVAYDESTRDTRHHEPEVDKCQNCYAG